MQNEVAVDEGKEEPKEIHPTNRKSLHFDTDTIADILQNFLVKVIAVEDRYDDQKHRVYLVYKFYLYCPMTSWTFFKRYDDFINLHKQVQIILVNHPEYEKFTHYQFPERHWWWTRASVISARSTSFEDYLRRALRNPAIADLICDFIQLDQHISDFEDGFQAHEFAIKRGIYDENDDDQHIHNNARTSFVGEVPLHPSVSSQKESTALLKPYRRMRELEMMHLSQLLSEESGEALFSFLPPLSQSEKFRLGFATYRDGWSLRTLYHHLSLSSPLILLIKVLQRPSLIGAYITSSLGPPSYDYKGDSECFVFALDPPSCRAKYITAVARSVLEHSRHPTPTPQAHTHPVDQDGEDFSSTLYEFLFSSPEVIALGGSRALGTNAIRLSGDLTHVSSGPSDTYSNPASLIPQTGLEQLEVAEIEIFCGVGCV
jgi:hypothetical protein